MARPQKGAEKQCTRTLGVRVTPALRDAIAAAAAHNGRNLTDEVRVALERHIAEPDSRVEPERG